MTKQQAQTRTQLLNAALRLVLFVSLFAALYAFLYGNNLGLRRLSRTAITVSLTFSMAMLLFTRVYGAFQIGAKRKRALFANETCTVLFTDIVTFLVLQVMNTNPQNPEANARLILFDKNLLLVLFAFLVQVALIFLIVTVGFFLYRKWNPPMRCLVIASTQEGADHVVDKLNAYPSDFTLSETISDDCPDWRETILENDGVFIADIPARRKEEIKRFCYENDLPLFLRAEMQDVTTTSAQDTILLDSLFLSLRSGNPTIIQRGIKRVFDIVASVLLLAVLSPLLLFIVIVLALSGNGSVIFRQERKTRNGRVFEIMKFRTMYVNTAENQSMTRDDDRITPFGRFLRKYRLDELPQLINIIRGDMSLVGPRPEMLPNLEKYLNEVPEFRYREKMRAGITGIAQLEGRYDTSPKDKAMLDLMYIEKFSLGLDLKLILRTLTVFFRRDKEGFTKEKKGLSAIRRTAKEGRRN